MDTFTEIFALLILDFNDMIYKYYKLKTPTWGEITEAVDQETNAKLRTRFLITDQSGRLYNSIPIAYDKITKNVLFKIINNPEKEFWDQPSALDPDMYISQTEMNKKRIRKPKGKLVVPENLAKNTQFQYNGTDIMINYINDVHQRLIFHSCQAYPFGGLKNPRQGNVPVFDFYNNPLDTKVFLLNRKMKNLYERVMQRSQDMESDLSDDENSEDSNLTEFFDERCKDKKAVFDVTEQSVLDDNENENDNDNENENENDNDKENANANANENNNMVESEYTWETEDTVVEPEIECVNKNVSVISEYTVEADAVSELEAENSIVSIKSVTTKNFAEPDAQDTTEALETEAEEPVAQNIVETEAEEPVAQNIVETEAEEPVAQNIVETEAEEPVAQNIVETEAEETVAQNIVETEAEETVAQNVVETEAEETVAQKVVETEAEETVAQNIVETEAEETVAHKVVETEAEENEPILENEAPDVVEPGAEEQPEDNLEQEDNVKKMQISLESEKSVEDVKITPDVQVKENSTTQLPKTPDESLTEKYQRETTEVLEEANTEDLETAVALEKLEASIKKTKESTLDKDVNRHTAKLPDTTDFSVDLTQLTGGTMDTSMKLVPNDGIFGRGVYLYYPTADKNYRWLNDTSHHSVRIDKLSFPTLEHYYHYMKFISGLPQPIDQDKAEFGYQKILEEKSANRVKNLTKDGSELKSLMTEYQNKYWNSQKDKILLFGRLHKLLQNPEIKTYLYGTEGAWILKKVKNIGNISPEKLGDILGSSVYYDIVKDKWFGGFQEDPWMTLRKLMIENKLKPEYIDKLLN